MAEIEHGSVVLYAYLWAREHDRGEESGRKARPCRVVLILRDASGRSTPLIFPITSRQPGADGAGYRHSRNGGAPREALYAGVGDRR